MDSSLSEILAAIDNPDASVSQTDVDALAREYPFFTLPSLMLLRRGGVNIDADTRRQILNRLVLNAPDVESLMMLTDPAMERWHRFYPEETPAEVSTSDAISRFLETYGHTSPAEDALLERLIFNPTPDYSTLLAREEESVLPAPGAPSDSQEALINAFILSHSTEITADTPTPAVSSAKPSAEVREADVVPQQPQHLVAPAPDSSLSESLAKIYIRQRRYEKAFEIIHTLSLNNPKKSAYFADQLRFLRKLMLARGSHE